MTPGNLKEKEIDSLLARKEFAIPPLSNFLDYEIGSSRWASYIGIPFLQKLTGQYFSRKVKAKYKRFRKQKANEAYFTLMIRGTDTFKEYQKDRKRVFDMIEDSYNEAKSNHERKRNS